MDLKIAGRVALVCGSSSGLGRATAKLLAEEGCRVALNGRDDKRLKEAAKSIAFNGEREVEPFRADVSVPQQADELAAEGITVNTVCPGYVRTERVEDLARQRSKQSKRTTVEEMNSFVADIPVGRMGEPEELAAAVAFLASERASYITGVALQV